MSVEIWWADLRTADVRSAAGLPPRERQRLEEVSNQAERGRRLVGELLLQRAARHARRAAETQVFEINRTCDACGAQHGRPVVADGRGPHVSVAHSGLLVSVATCVNAPVGVDVERLGHDGAELRGLEGWVAREARTKAGLLEAGTEMISGVYRSLTCPWPGYVAGVAVAVGARTEMDLVEHRL